MARLGKRPARRSNWMALGTRELEAGRLLRARQFFEKAHRTEPRNAAPLVKLARTQERIGEIDAAIANLTRAVKLKPDDDTATRSLSRIVRIFGLDEYSDLDPAGLKAALAAPNVDRQRLSEVAIAYLRDARGLVAQTDPSALVVKRTADVLAEPLLHRALASGVNKSIDVEWLLTGLRRALLLDVPAERFTDRDLFAFAVALAQQCQLNDHVFRTTPEEDEQLASLEIDWPAVKDGDADAGRLLLLHLLYAPVREVAAPHLSPADCQKMRPKALGEMLKPLLEAETQRAQIAEKIPMLGAIDDPVSKKVAAQYQTSPYPRWTSLHMPARGRARRTLSRFFPDARLGFLDEPFEALIAGAGTGQQAIASATSYGPAARVTAIDLSRPSLAYGQWMAQRLGVDNVTFAQADILSLPADSGPYHIIEAVGVLHHMADPFAGWRALLDRLAPGGLMLVGLYSKVSRANLGPVREHPAYPGPGCTDAEARAFRAALIEDRTDETLFDSQDFYTLNEFRDLVLHPQEVSFSLDEIASFLDEQKLQFAGFALPGLVVRTFLQTFPDSPWPGRLEDWAAFERENPRTFDGMYTFWCAPAD
ncbi:class I SAM-dependent methyltransferase [Dichotomicrobium thermohalophilum]|uniref:Tetratricopeptide repeat protein n=1 Tax=Dichotomicrobium thermohalophilum TaxID=933063 RepID=A0A397PNW8_9HYPH|nr:class I SAM-dependent methyltransferase [Dichotomicrobium thermohalophilum]RIA47734.1 tetratricopeptide repeat protein [Dichotomicrobium thermohalophilum]